MIWGTRRPRVAPFANELPYYSRIRLRSRPADRSLRHATNKAFHRPEKNCSTTESQIMKWISVNDALPEKDATPVLGYYDDLVREVLFLPSWNKYHPFRDIEYNDPQPVTHWMPLPAPPE